MVLEWIAIRERCPACAAREHTPYTTVRGVEAVRCGGCGIVYVRAVERSEAEGAPEGSFTELYDAAYFDKYLRHKGYARRVWRDRARIARIERYCRPGRLLDVGCSVGHFMDAARRRGWETWGVEPSEFAAQFARGRGNTVTQGTLADAEYPDAFFDLVTMWHVIEHLPEPRATLAEVKRILKPGGILALLTPNIGHLMARLHGPRWKHLHAEHLQLFSHHTLPAFLAREGLRPLLCRWVCRHSETLVLARR